MDFPLAALVVRNLSAECTDPFNNYTLHIVGGCFSDQTFPWFHFNHNLIFSVPGFLSFCCHCTEVVCVEKKLILDSSSGQGRMQTNA